MIFARSVFWALVLLLKSFIKASIKTSTIPSFGDIYRNRRERFTGTSPLAKIQHYKKIVGVTASVWLERKTGKFIQGKDKERIYDIYTTNVVSFIDENGNDNMEQVIEANYRQVKKEVMQIVESEMERIKNDPGLQHLIQQD